MANRPRNARVIDPTQSPRAMYGAELRFKREQAGLSQEALGAKLFLSGVAIAHMETGLRRVQPDYAEMLDELLGSDGFFVRNLAAGRMTPYPEHFADIAELEPFAQTIKVWEPLLVPGLLQTEAYALAVIRGYDPVLAKELVRERLTARLNRAHIFDNAHTPLYWAVVDEAMLRRPVGGPAVMAEQLRHVAAMIRRDRIIFQVLPFSVGAHAGLEGALKLMTFETDAPLAYLPSVGNGTMVDDPAAIKRHTLAYDLLGAAALPPEASLTLIEAAAEEYEHGVQVHPNGGDLA